MWRPRQVGGVWFYPINHNSWADLDLLKQFSEIPELNAVIDKKAKAFKDCAIYLVNEKLERQPDDNIVKLLRNPNWFQQEKEFLHQTKVFHEIFGNEYLYNFFGVGAKPNASKAIYTLPPNQVICEFTSSDPFFLGSDRPVDGIRYAYKNGGKEKELPIEQIIHLNDNRVNVTDATKKDFLKGESKMIALRPAINNIRMAYETRGVILKRRGALGIFSNAGADVAGQLPLMKKERNNIQRQAQQYGGLEGQDNFIITNANLKWQATGVSPDKMGLFQETQEDFYKIADAYGAPMELFASKEGRTYENQNEARKGFYDNTIIPEANEWIGAQNKYYYGPDSKVRLVMDYSHLSVFQEDLEIQSRGIASLVTALSTAFTDKAITIEEYRKALAKVGLAIG